MPQNGLILAQVGLHGNVLPSRDTLRGLIRASGTCAGFSVSAPDGNLVENVGPALRVWSRFFARLGGEILCLEDGAWTQEQMQLLRQAGFLLPRGGVAEKLLLPQALDTWMHKRGERWEKQTCLIAGADMPEGHDWAWRLSGSVQEMVLAGKNKGALRRLADALIWETGISAYVAGSSSRWASEVSCVVCADDNHRSCVSKLSAGAMGVWCPMAAPPLVPMYADLISAALVDWPEDCVMPEATSQQMHCKLTDAFACFCGIRPGTPEAGGQLLRRGFSLSGIRLNGCGVPWKNSEQGDVEYGKKTTVY